MDLLIIFQINYIFLVVSEDNIIFSRIYHFACDLEIQRHKRKNALMKKSMYSKSKLK